MMGSDRKDVGTFRTPVGEPSPSSSYGVGDRPAISYVRPARSARAPQPVRQLGPRLSYLPGLDGLRAIAVTAVLLYHADLLWFPGGFLGVEVFFVISGYLITALLVAEWERSGGIALASFWFRRARRLLPACYLLLVAVLAYAVIRLPGEVAGLRKDALASFAYVTNWYLIFNHKSYFEAVGRPSMLQHLWSLAVEEQFYLVWPVLLTLMLRFWRRRVIVLATLAGALASAAWMAILYRPDVDPSRVYYGTDTRATGLLIGAALAFVWVPARLRQRPAWDSAPGAGIGMAPLVLDVIGVAALCAIVGFFCKMEEFSPFLYRGGFLLLGLCTAVLVAVLVHPRAHLGDYVLGILPLRWIGTRSYSIYLWHWPVFMLTRPQLDIRLSGWPLLALRLVITIALAEASYRFVETPIRTGALGRAWRTLRTATGPWRTRLVVQWTSVGVSALLFFIVLGMAVASAQPAAPPAYLATAAVGTAAIPTNIAVAATPIPTPTMPPEGTPDATVLAAAIPQPTATTVPTATPKPPPRYTAIGDSVMVGAAPALRDALGEVDIEASIGLQAPAALDVLRARRDAGQLGNVVIIHIGDNGVFPASTLDGMMDVVGSSRTVIFVNLKVPRPWETNNNKVIADGVKKYPNAQLVDWRAASINHPEYFWDDGIHLRPEGAQFYAQLISEVIQR
jgi:peptidoglycan/LPS O-acetylase OafA/YrhL